MAVVLLAKRRKALLPSVTLQRDKFRKSGASETSKGSFLGSSQTRGTLCSQNIAQGMKKDFFFARDLSNPAIATQPNKTGDNYRPKLFLDNLAGPAPTHAWTLRQSGSPSTAVTAAQIIHLSSFCQAPAVLRNESRKTLERSGENPPGGYVRTVKVTSLYSMLTAPWRQTREKGQRCSS